MDSKLKKKTQLAAAARAEVSVSSAHRIEKGIVTGDKNQHRWKTRKDPFEKVWCSIILPSIEKHPNLLAITLLEKLQEDFPEEFHCCLASTIFAGWRQLRLPVTGWLKSSSSHLLFAGLPLPCVGSYPPGC